MKNDAYLDLVKSILNVVSANVSMAIDDLEENNRALVAHSTRLDKENTRLETENRLTKEDNNRLKGEYIKLLDKINVGNKPPEGMEKRKCTTDIDDYGHYSFLKETYNVEEFEEIEDNTCPHKDKPCLNSDEDCPNELCCDSKPLVESDELED